MKLLIAFDVDGIFKQKEELSEYIVGQLDAEKIDRMYNDGVDSKCVIVSPSPYYPKRDGKALWELFVNHETNDMRHQNLIDSANAISDDVDTKLYVSDNGDYDEARKSGFIYVDAVDFHQAIEENIDLEERFGIIKN